jgi:hypothetical protein
MSFRYSGSAVAHAPTAYPSSIRLGPGVRYPNTAPNNRPNFYHPGHGARHDFAIRPYSAFPYAYPPSYVYGYLPSDLLDDSYDNNYDTSQQPAPDNGSNYAQPQPDSQAQPDYGYAQPAPQPDSGYPQPGPQPESGYAYPQPMPAYPAYPEPQPGPQPAPETAYAYPGVPPGYAPQPAPAAPQMQYVPGSATTVILIYKDGRPPEQIQNYLATRSTLTVLDGGRRRDIPLSDLNIPATISANHQTGVDFQLPTTAR